MTDRNVQLSQDLFKSEKDLASCNGELKTYEKFAVPSVINDITPLGFDRCANEGLEDPGFSMLVLQPFYFIFILRV